MTQREANELINSVDEYDARVIKWLVIVLIIIEVTMFIGCLLTGNILAHVGHLIGASIVVPVTIIGLKIGKII